MRKSVSPKLVIVIVVIAVLIVGYIFVKKAFRPRKSVVSGGMGTIQDGRLVRPQRGRAAQQQQRGR